MRTGRSVWKFRFFSSKLVISVNVSLAGCQICPHIMICRNFSYPLMFIYAGNTNRCTRDRHRETGSL